MRNLKEPRSAQIKADRCAFWHYCQQTGFAARQRASAKGVPCTIDAHFIDGLLVDQQWRCAVSGVPLSTPREAEKYRRDPFGPSLDRIVPDLGYVAGNVRVVTNIVNSAMNEWGVEALLKLVEAMRGRQE